MHGRLMTRQDDIVVYMHDCPEVISQAFISPLLDCFSREWFSISQLRGREVSLTHLAHNQEIAGAEPACATILKRLVTATLN